MDANLLSKLVPLSDLRADVRDSVLQKASLRGYKAGDVVFVTGDIEPEALYLVDGELAFEVRQLESEDILVDTVDEGIAAIDPGKGEGHAQTSSSSRVQLVAAPYSSFSIVNPTTCMVSCGR